MYTSIIQLKDFLEHGRLHYFMLFYLFVWVVWTLKAAFALRYRPYTKPYSDTTSVIVPVVDEKPEDFRRVLQSIKDNGPTEVLVVINGARNKKLEAVCDQMGVPRIWRSEPGKRQALIYGMRFARGNITVLQDSDTLWAHDTLEELIKPFADKKVGGVTTHQRIYGRDRHPLARFADWMEDTRTSFSMPAMSSFGTVGCLPGRTIAFRREVIARNVDKFLSETFLGIHLEISDDRTLTNYALKDGYKTVYQRTARVWTDTPVTWKKYMRQQYRWAQGSQYNTLRMATFMLRNTPFLAFAYLSEIIIPFFWLGTMVNLVWKITYGDPMPYSVGTWWEQVILVSAGVLASVAVRNLPHLKRCPEDWPFLPVYIILQACLLTPIRIIGFFRLAHDSSWGTRADAHKGKRQIHVSGLIPYALGFTMLSTFAVLGPFVETRRQIGFIVHHHTTVTAIFMVALVLCFTAAGGTRYVMQRLRHTDSTRMRRFASTQHMLVNSERQRARHGRVIDTWSHPSSRVERR